MKNKRLILMALILLLFAFSQANAAVTSINTGSLVTSPPNANNNSSGLVGNNSEAQVKVGPGFYDDYKKFLNNVAPSTPLNGGFSNDMEQVLPSFQFPFSVFKINLTGNQQYEKGDTVSLKANFTYTFKGNDIRNQIIDSCKQKFLKDASKCEAPMAYEVPQFDNLGVFVQVWRKETDGLNTKGDYLVDEFYTQENVSMKSGDSKDFTLNWKIPTEIKTGNYYFVISINKNKEFDILGNPLTVMNSAKNFEFQVAGDNKAGIELDKNNIKINNLDYGYRRPAPSIKPGEVTIQIPLNNLSSEAQKVNVKYELFRWGQENPKDVIDSKTESVDAAVNSKNPLKYTFATNDLESTYDLRITASTQNSQSMSNIRFVVEGQNKGIFRYVDMVKNEDGYSPLVCIRNANWTGQFSGKLNLTLNDNKFEQDGIINAAEGNCYLIKKLKVSSINCAKLKGEILTKEGKTTDSQEMTFTCSDKVKQIPTSASTAEVKPNNGRTTLIAVLLLILVGISGYFVYSRRTNK